MNRHLACLGLTLLMACSLEAYDSEGSAYDSGPPTLSPDAGILADAGTYPPEVPSGIPADERSRPGSGIAGRMSDPTCYDGVDSNANGVLDCADPRCFGERSCCVGNALCCSPVSEPGLPDTIDFATCTGPDISTCNPESLAVFGVPAPRVDAGRFTPGGGPDADSGAILGDPLNLQSDRLEIEIDFHLPSDCGRTCLESAAVGLFQASPADAPGIRPEVSLLASGSGREVRLLIHGEQIAAWSVDADAPPSVWLLIAKPDGRLQVSRDGTPLATDIPFRPATQMWLALYGRNRNPGDPSIDTASISRIGVQRFACDMPASWNRPATPVTLLPPPATTTLGAPSVGVNPANPDDALLAFAEGDEIRLYERSGETWQALTEDTLSGSDPFNSGGLADPSLVWTSEERRIYFTAIAANGTRTIGAALPIEGGSGLTPLGYPLISHATAPQFTDIESPSVVLHSSGTWVLMARATDAEGLRSLPIFTSADGLVWTLLRAPDLATLNPADSAPVGGNNEFADPNLTIHADVWYLHLARRTGARWRIEAWTSDQLLFWRPLGTVLDRQAGPAPTLSIRGPSASVQTDTMDLFALAFTDGRHVILHTQRHANSNGTFP